MAKRVKDKRKRVTVRLAKRKGAGGRATEPYQILEWVLKNKRDDLLKAKVKIVIAFTKAWQSDADKHLKLGSCAKRKDIDREMIDCDFLITLNDNVWPSMSADEKQRLIYHELLHAEIKYDSDGSTLKDDRGRVVTRIRQHDFEEFREIIEQYGTETDFAAVAIAASNDSKRPLLHLNDKTKAEQKPDQSQSRRKKKSTKKKRTVRSMQETVTATE